MNALIRFDGGSKPNPGAKYGSFAITLGDVFEIKRLRFPLGFGTNNEAEFESLLEALKDLSAACHKAQVPAGEIDVSILTDSTIVKNWLRASSKFNPAKCKNVRRIAMGALAAKCAAALKPFHSFEIEWNSRTHNVEAFGH